VDIREGILRGKTGGEREGIRHDGWVTNRKESPSRADVSEKKPISLAVLEKGSGLTVQLGKLEKIREKGLRGGIIIQHCKHGARSGGSCVGKPSFCPKAEMPNQPYRRNEGVRKERGRAGLEVEKNSRKRVRVEDFQSTKNETRREKYELALKAHEISAGLVCISTRVKPLERHREPSQEKIQN